MKRLAAVSLALFASCAVHASQGPDGDPEARLDAALAGRVAGDPVACVQSRQLRGNTPIDENRILFRGPGSTVYINNTRSACSGIRPWHALRSRRIGTSLCEGDLVIAFDPANGVERGGCTLGEFTPYRRARRGS